MGDDKIIGRLLPQAEQQAGMGGVNLGARFHERRIVFVEHRLREYDNRIVRKGFYHPADKPFVIRPERAQPSAAGNADNVIFTDMLLQKSEISDGKRHGAVDKPFLRKPVGKKLLFGRCDQVIAQVTVKGRAEQIDGRPRAQKDAEQRMSVFKAVGELIK